MRFWLAALIALAATAASAEDGSRRNAPGDFDFYVLSLSWSPSYCAIANRRDPQCSGEEKHGFVVHGLWPQYEVGWPEYCTRRQSIPRRLVDTMLDLMPSRRLIYDEWDKHGTCTGLSAANYFALTRKAAGTVHVPDDFADGDAPDRMSPAAVEQAFIAANSGLRPDMMAVSCDGGRLQEVRICLDKQLGFTSCPEVDHAGCRSGSVSVPDPDGAL